MGYRHCTHRKHHSGIPEVQLLGAYTKQNSFYQYFWHHAYDSYDEAISSGNSGTLFFHERDVIRVMDVHYN